MRYNNSSEKWGRRPRLDAPEIQTTQHIGTEHSCSTRRRNPAAKTLSTDWVSDSFENVVVEQGRNALLDDIST